MEAYDQEQCARVMENGSVEERRQTVEQLKPAGAAAIPILASALQDDDWKVRRGSVELLAGLRDPTTVRPLCGALKDWDWEVRRRAARALMQLPIPGADGSPPNSPTESRWHWPLRRKRG